MKQLDKRTLEYIAKAYGGTVKNYAGDASDPSASEVQALDEPEDASSDSEEDESDGTTGASSDFEAPNDSSNQTQDSSLPITGDYTSGATGSYTPPATTPPNSNPNPIPTTQTPQVLAPQNPFLHAAEEQKQANLAEAQALGNQGSQEAAAIDAGQAKIDALPTENDINAAQKVKNDALLQAYTSNKLDPNRALENMGTGQKIIAGIGLLLGGMNSVKVIDSAIDRDIDAQKNSQNQQINLWKMNQDQYGNDQAANLATKNQILVGVQAQLQKAASQAKGPIALAQAQRGNAIIDNELANNNGLIGLNQTLHGATQQGLNETTFNQALTLSAQRAPEMYKDAQARYLPNIGVAQIPIDPDGRKEVELNQEYSDLLNRSAQFQKSLPLNRAAITPDQVGQANALRQSFVELGTRAQGINRLNESEIKLANDAFSPGKLSYQSSLSAINTLQGATNGRKQLLLDKYKITPFQSSVNNIPTQPAQATPSARGTPEIRYNSAGKAFIQGQNGAPVPYTPSQGTD